MMARAMFPIFYKYTTPVDASPELKAVQQKA
jgi:hypothetical protein